MTAHSLIIVPDGYQSGNDMTWTSQGTCRTPAADGVEFFPTEDTQVVPLGQLDLLADYPRDHDSGTPAPQHPAWDAPRALCTPCPVQQACALYAITLPEPDGMWGGLTPTERASLSSDRVIPTADGWEHGTLTGYRNKGCKCLPCRRAGSRYQAKYRQAQAVTSNDTERRQRLRDQATLRSVS